MPNKKISQLVELTTTPADNDLLVVVDVDAVETKKLTYSNLISFLSSNPDIRYPTVNTFADLPSPASDYTGQIWVVLQSTGVYIFSRKEAGLYYSNGSNWSRLGNIPSFFSSSNFAIYDGSDNTKRLQFNLNSITTGNTRTLTIPDKSGTIALLSDISGASTTWSGLALNIQYNGVETSITGGLVLTGVLNSTTYYRFISSTNTANGYPNEDAFYTTFNGTDKPTVLIAERGQP